MLEKRKNSLRLKEYDYSLPGPYFVTICADGKKNIFSEEKRNCIVQEIIEKTRELKAGLHSVSVAGNHIHILVSMPGNKSCLLSRYIANIKANLTKSGCIDGVMQRSFYDHIIRNEREFKLVLAYVENHPYKGVDSSVYSEDEEYRGGGFFK